MQSQSYDVLKGVLTIDQPFFRPHTVKVNGVSFFRSGVAGNPVLERQRPDFISEGEGGEWMLVPGGWMIKAPDIKNVAKEFKYALGQFAPNLKEILTPMKKKVSVTNENGTATGEIEVQTLLAGGYSVSAYYNNPEGNKQLWHRKGADEDSLVEVVNKLEYALRHDLTKRLAPTKPKNPLDKLRDMGFE